MKKSDESGEFGFLGALFLVLLVLKLTGIIGWSWWLVTAPLWAPVDVILVIAAVIFVTSYLFTKESKK